MRAFIFDLDGTLVDTVYARVLAWQRALAECDLHVCGSRIHAGSGMGGSGFVRTVARERGREIDDDAARAVHARHVVLLAELLPDRRPLRGAIALLAQLRDQGVPHGIATSSRRADADVSLRALAAAVDVAVVTHDDVAQAKPAPALLLECARRLGAPPAHCLAVGDTRWDMLAARRAGMTAIGVLTGGADADVLRRAGAASVHVDLCALATALRELGIPA